jgi:hypothetical protein
LADADNDLHAGMCAAQPRQPGDLLAFTEQFRWKGYEVEDGGGSAFKFVLLAGR